MKKILTGILAATLLLSSFAGCSGSGNSNSQASGSSVSTSTNRQKIVFWYAYKGDEAKTCEQVVADYNKSQSKYQVEGLSVTDKQKIIVAMSNNESPDVITSSNQDISSYQSSGLLENLSNYVTKTKFDMDVFSKQAITANTINNVVYGLPLSAYSIQMYYNKDLLKKIGYSEPPKTMEEMYEMAVKATTLDSKGNIETLGYPLFPLASAKQELIYGFGGRWWAEDGKTLTPDSQGVLDSLNMNVKYRQKYGIQKVQSIIATANTNRYTAKDMFFAGKQLFRFDGCWLPTMMKKYNSTVNYGIALIPGTKANPNLQGTSRFETTSVLMPVGAQNKEGAWDLIKYLSDSSETKKINLGIGNLPALKSLYTDKDILAVPGFSEFVDALKLEKGIQYPQISNYAKYSSLIDQYLDYVYNGSKTPTQAMSELKSQSANLK